MDALDGLTSRDLKLAIGEEVQDESTSEDDFAEDSDETEEVQRIKHCNRRK